MIAVEGGKMLVALFGLSLVVFALVPSLGFMELAKMVAGSLGLTILFVVLYPQVRGVRKGDTVQVLEGPLAGLFGIMGTAADDCRMEGELRVRFARGREAVGVLKSYEGLFSPARVKLMYEKGEVISND
ncbi:hypothetical protein JW721_04245 [Candidatus Micrarchaeota archaeon]|nr:hypothetical protein [Candidatus Micrarchaeota archaeon]